MKKTKSAKLVKKVLDAALMKEVVTVSSPFAYQEKAPKELYERMRRNDSKKNN